MRSLTLLCNTAKVANYKADRIWGCFEIGRLIGIKIDDSQSNPDDSEGSNDAGYEEEASIPVNARHRSETGDTFGYSTTFDLPSAFPL